jgi:hypothetical protein
LGFFYTKDGYDLASRETIPGLCNFHSLRLRLQTDSHFVRPILIKLAQNLKHGKNRIPLFLFFFKMKNNEDIRN